MCDQPEPNLSEYKILSDIQKERTRQVAQWGEQHHPDGQGWRSDIAYLYRYREFMAEVEGKATPTWRNILQEEVVEAFAEADTDKLRTELIQCAAVCIAWVKDLDSRSEQAS